MPHLPPSVSFIIDRLESQGFEAHVVGGCVRDALMEIIPHDWDICTSALPDQIIEVFSDQKIVPTGLKHGTVSVIINSVPYEITTYRIDGEYKDNRHPENVEFVSDIKSDLMRRDFTVNAIAYNPGYGLIDPFGGFADIQDRVIRCVGDPNKRFQEDALRVLRAIRFSIKYKLKIEQLTLNSLYLNSPLLRNISAERISSEIIKMLSNTVVSQTDLDSITALSHCLCLIDKRIMFLGNDLIDTSPNLPLRLAIIFNSDEIVDIMKKLRFSNNMIAEASEIRKLGNEILKDIDGLNDSSSLLYYSRNLLKKTQKSETCYAVEFAKQFVVTERSRKVLDSLLESIGECLARNDAYKISSLAITGYDLQKIGYSGIEIGSTLDKLLDMVMQDLIENTHESLINKAQTLKTQIE